jgi:hypothetical protein
MAKRITGVEKGKTSRSKKTAKRLQIKADMLEAKATRKHPRFTKAGKVL